MPAGRGRRSTRQQRGESSGAPRAARAPCASGARGPSAEQRERHGPCAACTAGRKPPRCRREHAQARPRPPARARRRRARAHLALVGVRGERNELDPTVPTRVDHGCQPPAGAPAAQRQTTSSPHAPLDAPPARPPLLVAFPAALPAAAAPRSQRPERSAAQRCPPRACSAQQHGARHVRTRSRRTRMSERASSSRKPAEHRQRAPHRRSRRARAPPRQRARGAAPPRRLPARKRTGHRASEPRQRKRAAAPQRAQSPALQDSAARPPALFCQARLRLGASTAPAATGVAAAPRKLARGHAGAPPPAASCGQVSCRKGA